MKTGNRTVETPINDEGMVRIPTSLQQRLGIDSGDKLRWGVTEDDDLSVKIVRKRYGAFEDDDLKAPLGDEDTK